MKSITALLALHGVSFVSAANIFVSPSGSDNNAGDSATEPFRTLIHAQKAVRKLATHSMSEDVDVHLSPGTYPISAPLLFDAKDSGKNGFTVNWIGANATVSGGIEITGWAAEHDGIYSASVPVGSLSRNLFVAGQAANYGRRMINRTDFDYDSTGMQWNLSSYDWLMTTPGIENAEVRFINSFTDRYAPIKAVSHRELIMKQWSWTNQIWGWDTVNKPYGDFGVWVQNCKALLTEGGEFYLDSEAGKVYYKPLDGEDIATVDAYLALQEALIVLGGTYEDPVHDISFKGVTFAHSTWLAPADNGYVDQQTGGYIGENVTYPAFDASRPRWWQIPSAIQISAARDIDMSACTFHQLGTGGIGIGNDPNAHITNIGLGASNISISNGYFTQIMGNGITAGGIQGDAHHPIDPRMTNSHINISGNIFYNNSALFTSTVPIFTTYIQYSTISHNDISVTTYSAICHGYGWGSNDAGGSVAYVKFGLYNYQPMYTTPTTLKDNLIDGNLIHDYGLALLDLGGIYSLSRAPGTLVTNNYMYNSAYKCLYPDEGSSNITYINNVCFPDGLWYGPNDQNTDYHTGNLSLIDNWGKDADPFYPLVGYPDYTGIYNDTFVRNRIVSDVTKTSAAAQKAAYRAGILPAARTGRPVTNREDIADGYLSIGRGDGGHLAVNLTNFDDVDFTDVSFDVSAKGAKVVPKDLPKTIPANSFAIATYDVKGTQKPRISAKASYKNPRTGRMGAASASGSIQLGN